MRIILRGGPHNGERHDNVADNCQRFHRISSFYGQTTEIDDEGRQVFKYDSDASEEGKVISTTV